MRCLSIRQPWAWLICAGKKTIENRVWQTPYRGTIAIHASTTKSEVGRLRKHFNTDVFSAADFQFGAIIGFADIVDVQPYGRGHEQNGFACGPYCFRLENGRLLKVPVPMMGKLNLFTLDNETADKLLAAETHTIDLNSDSLEARIANTFVFEPDPVGTYLDAIEELTGKIDSSLLYDMCSRIIELEPEVGDGYLARVIVALDSGLEDNLKTDTDNLLRLWPDDLDAIAYGSDACIVLEEFDRAKFLLDRLISQQPEVYGFLIQHGRALFELGDVERGRAELELAVQKLDGDNHCVSLCHVYLASIAQAQHQPDVAKHHLTRAQELGRDSSEMDCIYARIALSDNDTVRAQHYIAKALKSNPQCRDAKRLQESMQ